MRTTALALALLAGPALAQPPFVPPPCVFTTEMGATYDLAPMFNPFGYDIYDTNNKTAPGAPVYALRFSLCTNIDPAGTASLPQCLNTTGSDGTVTTGPAAAFRYCTQNCASAPQQCQRLGADAFNQSRVDPMQWNPARGVMVTYFGGDNCNSRRGVRPAALQLDIQCADRGGLISRDVDIISDGSGCFYNAIFASTEACPLECPLVTSPPSIIRRLCGGRGICDYDRSKSLARCFCNEGWSGADCMSQGDAGLPAAPSYVGSIAGAFIGGLLGGAALLVAGLFGRAKMTGAVSFVDGITFPASMMGGGGAAGAGASRGGSAGAAASVLGGFGSEGSAAAGVTGMDAAYEGLGGLAGGDAGYVAPDLSAPSAAGGGINGDGPLLA